MAFLDQIQELARRARTGDDWYYKDPPYILELRSRVGLAEAPSGVAYMTLPLGPENYRIQRVFRQGVEPTLGGLVAEERGLLWAKISVRGTFGLEPKFGFDSALGPDPTMIAPQGERLSGPAWTRRMIANYFERYAALKSSQLTARSTKLIWHDTKLGESWVVVPDTIDIDRSVSRRGQYPWAFELTAIERDDGPPAIPAERRGVFAAARDTLAAVNAGLALANGAMQDLIAVSGEVRVVIATIDSTLDKVATILRSTRDYVDGIDPLIAVGRSTILESIAEIQAAAEALEGGDAPDIVRQTLMEMADGLDEIAAQRPAFGSSYEAMTLGVASVESGAYGEDPTALDAAAAAPPPGSVAELAKRRERAADAELVDAGALSYGREFSTYTGTQPYVVTQYDTIQSIAARHLGDGARWYDIALLNGLRYPYVSDTGAPGTVGPGDTIRIPVNGTITTDAALDRLGVNIRLQESPDSRIGRPHVGIAIDRRTMRDVALISGIENLAQALQLRLWTERGRMPLLPNYGLMRAIGVKNAEAFAAILRLNVIQALRQDSRVESVPGVQMVREGDTIEIDATVIPIGQSEPQAVSLSLV